MSSVRLCAIVAQSENRVIGRGNKMPWHIPEDFRHFKSVTMGKPVIMGRKTFESIGKPLPGRGNIVVSRSFSAEGVEVRSSLEEALALAKEIAGRDGVDEIMIIGGGQIYEQALPITDRVYLTEVHQVIADGDAFFPALNKNEWRETTRADHEGYSFITLDRIR